MSGPGQRIDHIDRRDHLRLYQDLACNYILIDCEKSKAVSEKQAGVICNISSSGVLLIANEIPEEHKELLYGRTFKIILEIQLPKIITEPIVALAKVAWLSKRDEGKYGERKFELGLCFSDIGIHDQDILIDFILNTFLKLLKNE